MKRGNFLFVEKVDNQYVVSMTPELQDDIGTVGFVEFLSEDDVKKDEPIVSLEASKTVMDILCPVSGRIVERNEAAEGQPNLFNSAKPEENWIVKLEQVDEADFEQLEEA